jgi:hypothetical protein
VSSVPFNLEIPIDAVFKAGERGKERRIGGIISTEHTDRQSEVVLQRGLKWDSFLENGWLNDNHSKDTAGIVGYPERVEKTTYKGKPAHRLEGYLLEGHKKADEIWELCQSLQRTGRRLGFSIEGKILRRAGPGGKVIAEAAVSNVAVTNCPVNTETGLDILAKSIFAVEQSDDVLYRALTAGQGVEVPDAPAAGDGAALRTESLEGGCKCKRGLCKCRGKDRGLHRVTKSEAAKLIRTAWPGLPDRVVNAIWRMARREETR